MPPTYSKQVSGPSVFPRLGDYCRQRRKEELLEAECAPWVLKTGRFRGISHFPAQSERIITSVYLESLSIPRPSAKNLALYVSQHPPSSPRKTGLLPGWWGPRLPRVMKLSHQGRPRLRNHWGPREEKNLPKLRVLQVKCGGWVPSLKIGKKIILFKVQLRLLLSRVTDTAQLQVCKASPRQPVWLLNSLTAAPKLSGQT